MTDVIDKLRELQRRRLVAEFCRKCDKPRSWFYKVLVGKASLVEHLTALDDVLKPSRHPIVEAREKLGLTRRALAEALGISRQTIFQWERQPATAERLNRIEQLSHRLIP